MAFHDEELNRDVLDRMKAAGDDLKTVRPVDFSHVFLDGRSAEAFAEHVHGCALRADVEESGCVPDMPWDVTVTIDMAPSPEAVTATEAELNGIAASYGGRADGWGCLSITEA